MMIPVFGVLQVMIVLGEPLEPTATLGTLVVLVGIWLSQGGRVPMLWTQFVTAPRPALGA